MPTIDPGYRIVASCLSSHECVGLVKELSGDSVSRRRAGARHLMGHPSVSTLANDRRLTELAGEYLGCAAIPFRATLFEKLGTANWLITWHQDTALPLGIKFDLAGWGPWSVKDGANYAHAPAWALSRVIALRIHFDSSNPDNGPLRVIPGSHLAGVLSDEAVREVAAEKGQVECCVPIGGVIAIRPLIIHSSSKARTANPRRVLHIEYADSLDLGEGIRLAVL